MKKAVKGSALISKYSALFHKNPRSRVFAPLAEAYRKIGMFDESLKILRGGIKNHPDYVLGYIVLAHVYFDLERFELAYSNLRPFVSKNLDNPTLQKLFAETCYRLGYSEESLNTYKYLMFLNPKDQIAIGRVKELEDAVLKNEQSQNIVQNSRFIEDSNEDDWVQVNLSKPNVSDKNEDWHLTTGDPIIKFKNDIKSKNFEIKVRDLDDNYFAEEDSTVGYEDEEVESPFINHTLVDLYVEQKHYDKALEILESILKLHPFDVATKRKIEEVRNIKLDKNENKSSFSNFLQDEKNKIASQKDLLEEKLNLFLNKLKSESKNNLKSL
jgi:tetratricopeptide (TPR) repeat protein